MFEVFIKDFMNGTRFEAMTIDKYVEIVRLWNEGEDVLVNGHLIKNNYIESVYARRL